jgi:hypothetical protein
MNTAAMPRIYATVTAEIGVTRSLLENQVAASFVDDAAHTYAWIEISAWPRMQR